jgi:hypothetical protein
METNKLGGLSTNSRVEVTQILALAEANGNSDLVGELGQRVIHVSDSEWRLDLTNQETSMVFAYLSKSVETDLYYGHQNMLMVQALRRQFKDLRQS